MIPVKHLSSVLSSASCLISPLTRSCAVQLHDKKVGVTSATSATRAIQRTIRFTLKGIRSENDESNDSMVRSKCKKQATRKMCYARTWLGKGPNILRSCILLSSWTATPHHSHTSPVRKMLPEESIWRAFTIWIYFLSSISIDIHQEKEHCPVSSQMFLQPLQ